MAKHVLKTILVTVFALIFVVAFFLMGTAVFAPSKIADLYNDAGFRYRAKIYAEKAYEKNDSIDDLVLLVKVSSLCSDENNTAKYAKILLERSDFANYCEINSLDAEKFYDEIASEYIKSCYSLGGMKVSELCNEAMNYSRDYRELNAVESLILEASKEGDKSTLSGVLNVLTAFQNAGNCPERSRERLNKDVENLKTLIGRL